MKNCAASVATARYSPLMRRLGIPKTIPTTVVINPARINTTTIFNSGTRTAMLYAAYAPTIMNAPVPSDICPQ